MNKKDSIFVAGASGMVGSALVRALIKQGHTNIIGSYHNRKPDSSMFEPKSLNSSFHHSSLITLYEIDLASQSSVHDFFAAHKPDYVFLAAARVGGIQANNTYPADFIHDNLIIQDNVIHAANQHGVKRLLFLGSSCIYPKHAPQPMKEEHLLTGPLEPTNEPYAIAKIAGIKTCEAYNRQYGTRFAAVMPTNLYGPNDNFDLETSHVLPALIRKFHLGKCLEQDDWESLRADLTARPINGVEGTAPKEAILKALAAHGINLEKNQSPNPSAPQPPGPSDPQSPGPSAPPPPRPSASASLSLSVSPSPGHSASLHLWGTGTPRREFLHVDDMAEACVHLMNLGDAEFDAQFVQYPRPCFVNVGIGQDCTIKELAETVQYIVGYQGQIRFDPDKPDGTPQKLLDVRALERLGWKAAVSMEEGVGSTYSWYNGRDSGSH